MRRRLLRGLAALLVVAACWLAGPRLLAQVPSGTTPEQGERVPALPYTVAALFTLFIMLIVCKPSRKG